MRRIILLVIALSCAGAGAAHAQGFSVGLRGGGALPVGSFAAAEQTNDAFLAGARTGFGLGLDLAFALGSNLGLYAGFDHMRFDCQPETCASNGTYTLGGAALGLKVLPFAASRLAPWAKAGVTFNELEGEFGAGTDQRLLTDRAPGFEVAVGLEIPVAAMLALTPQARYVGQNFRYNVPGVVGPERTEQGVGYLTFDLGLSYGSIGRR